jgi:hypothetical protein
MSQMRFIKYYGQADLSTEANKIFYGDPGQVDYL